MEADSTTDQQHAILTNPRDMGKKKDRVVSISNRPSFQISQPVCFGNVDCIISIRRNDGYAMVDIFCHTRILAFGTRNPKMGF